MKKFKLQIPLPKSEAAADFLYANEVRVMLSYSVSDFFDSKIIIICAVPDDKIASFQEQFKTCII
jgi:hypothetical protein